LHAAEHRVLNIENACFRANMAFFQIRTLSKIAFSRLRVKNASVTTLAWETPGRRVRQSQVAAKRLLRQSQHCDPGPTRKNIRVVKHRVPTEKAL
jgi:hypothetical protein